MATAFAVLRAGARPILVDVDEQTLLVDPAAVRGAMTATTKVVIPVHLFPQLAPTELIEDVVGPDIALIEDAAQAQGASRWGRFAGSFEVAAAMSFTPSKNLGAYGDVQTAWLWGRGLFRGRKPLLRKSCLFLSFPASQEISSSG